VKISLSGTTLLVSPNLTLSFNTRTAGVSTLPRTANVPKMAHGLKVTTFFLEITHGFDAASHSVQQIKRLRAGCARSQSGRSPL